MIQYSNPIRSNNTDGYNAVFTEAVTSIQNTKHVNPLAQGELLYTDSLAYNAYVEKLTEGFSPAEAQVLTEMLNNNRAVVLQESSLAGIPPIAALNAPTIVKMWAKSGLKNVIPTQVVDKPAFSVITNIPVMIDSDGTKHRLPESLEAEDTAHIGNTEKVIVKYALADLANGLDVRTATGEVLTAGVQLDEVKARFTSEEINDVVVKEVSRTGDSAEAIKTNVKMSLERKFMIDVKFTDGTDTIFGGADLEGRKLQFVSAAAKATHITVELQVSSANHTQSTEISFEIEKRDFEVPTGRHFEVNLPIEFINDMYALYKIDSASTATETMSNVITQKLEQEIDGFLTASIEGRNVEAYVREFNVYPNASYAIQPKDWLEELKRVIDYLANRIKSDSYFYQGYFVIYGNPVDVALLPNVSWSFNSASDNVNGIGVQYSMGAMSGSNKYVIVSSDLVKRGALKMIMVPTVDDYSTYKYYPYTFNIVNNYLNANGKKTGPNLMMTKRHIMAEFMPLSAKIKILNNDGTIGYQS